MGIQIEVWKDIKGFAGIYKVSNFGQIKRINKNTSTYIGKILNHDVGKLGYHRVTLYKKGVRKRFQVARLVCATFNGPRPKRHEVNHINENKDDNQASNLEWLLPQDNKRHSFLMSGKKCYFERKKYTFISPNGKTYEIIGLRAFCERRKLDPGAMSCVARGEYKQHKGWKA